MSEDAEIVIGAQLAPEEHLFWVGQPKRGIRLEPSDIAMIPFSLMWGGFAIFWEIGAILMGAPFFFAIWGIPFILVGIYLIVGRFFVDAWRRSRIYYGITDHRILVVCHFLQQSVRSLNLHNLTDVSLTECKDGRGTIAFGSRRSMFGSPLFFNNPLFGHIIDIPSFRAIENARGVYEIIQKLQSVSHG